MIFYTIYLHADCLTHLYGICLINLSKSVDCLEYKILTFKNSNCVFDRVTGKLSLKCIPKF